VSLTVASRPASNPNRLLSALSTEEYERIGPLLDVIPLRLKEVLHKAGDPVDHVYFPGGGFCSMLTALADGSMVEVATIGREGMAGGSAIIVRTAADPSTTMVQAEIAICYRMTSAAFCNEMDRRSAFSRLLTRYGQALVGVIMQSAACNAVHPVEQRLARWLLAAHDRVERNEFPLTQEFAAMMLGVTRPTVTLVAQTLQREQLITYHRGCVVILDRQGLERASCECHNAVAGLLDQVKAVGTAVGQKRGRRM
jgi:CRP-like cAMP-binding protein